MDDQITLRVPDLHCEGCVASIRSVLEHFPGAREVKSDLETSTLTVRYDLASITPLAIKTQLAAIGYPERLLGELGIKHRYTRPYRPRTNGKVERFWRTLNEGLLDGTTFETVEELKEGLALYLLYSDTERPHQGLGGKAPLQAL